MEKCDRNTYSMLPPEARERLLRRLPEKRPDFEFVRLVRFEAFGQATDTALYHYSDGAEFVFVPGGRVTLGWDGFALGMDEDTRSDLTGALAEWGFDNLEEFLRENSSPVRQVDVPSMLVEREPREIGWYEVPADDPAIQQNEKLKPYLEKFLARPKSGSYELDCTLKMFWRGAELVAQLYEPCGYDKLLAQVAAEGFALPTEDEWEYLCGGGSRTLWRWGDSFDYNMKIPHFTAEDYPAQRWDISQPNQFGLKIAFDPYIQEVVSGPDVFLKGGDGGCNICGGMGVAMGFLPVATYYKGVSKEDDELNMLEDIGGDYSSYRRILRL